MRRLAVDTLGPADRLGAHVGASMNVSEELIARARRGDEDAFRLIFERYTLPVISFLFYMVGRRELAEELAQETFVRAYRGLSALRDDAKLSTWLFGIAKNVAREHRRSRRREGLSVTTDAASRVSDQSPSPAASLLNKELSGVMRRALDRLDEDKRLVFTLKVYRQHSYEEISEITGFSLPKVRNDLSRARAELRRLLSAYLRVER